MISVTYAITQAEFSEAQQIWCRKELKKLPGRTLHLTVCIIFGGFVGLSLHYLPTWLVAAVSISLLCIVLVCQWRKKAIRKYQFAARADRMDAVQVQIDESGYRDERSAMCGGWIVWGGFSGWREGPSTFVLGQSLAFTTVPKAALSPEQQTELRSLLQSNLGPAV